MAPDKSLVPKNHFTVDLCIRRFKEELALCILQFSSRCSSHLSKVCGAANSLSVNICCTCHSWKQDHAPQIKYNYGQVFARGVTVSHPFGNKILAVFFFWKFRKEGETDSCESEKFSISRSQFLAF